MNQENSFGPCFIILSNCLSAAAAFSGWRSQISTASAPSKALFIASITPDEKTGSMKA
jgi:hypothetical protein